MNQISDDPYCNNSEGKTDEIAHGFSHEETRKFGQKPTNKSLHISHEAKHLPT